MKRIIIATMFLLTLISTKVEVSASDDLEVRDMINELAYAYDELKGYDTLQKYMIFDFEDKLVGYSFFIIKDDEQQGFVVYRLGEGVIQLSVTTTEVLPSEFDKLYYQFPGKFYNHEQKEDLIDNAIERTSKEVRYTGDGLFYTNVTWDWRKFLTGFDEEVVYYDLSSGIPLLSSNTTTSGIGYHTQTIVNNVPDFLNYDNISCVPTATAMIMAYYDNEYRDSWTSHDIGDYPLIAEPDGYSSEEALLVLQFRGLMKTDKYGSAEDGTSIMEWSYALTKYFDDETLYGYYEAYLSSINDNTPVTPNEYSNYKILINKGNPAILFVMTDTSSPWGADHAVVGIGHFANRTMGYGAIVYDEFTHGITLIKDDYIDYFGFIYND